MADGHQFSNILLGGRGGTNPGQLRIYSGGIVWRKQGGGKVVEVAKADIASLSWTRVSKGYQLGVRMKAGLNVKFNGFREQCESTLLALESTAVSFLASIIFCYCEFGVCLLSCHCCLLMRSSSCLQHRHQSLGNRNSWVDFYTSSSRPKRRILRICKWEKCG